MALAGNTSVVGYASGLCVGEGCGTVKQVNPVWEAPGAQMCAGGVSGQYIVTEKIGESYYRAPTYMTFEEYQKWSAEQEKKAYFDQLSRNVSGDFSNDDPLKTIDVKNRLLDRLFGGNKV